MSLDASMLPTIVQEVFLLKTFFETGGGLTAQAFFCGVRTVGQTKLSGNLQLTMILKLKVKPGWVSVLKVNHEFLDPKKTFSWTHLTRVTAWVFRFVTSCRHRNEHVKVTKGSLSVEELVRAEEFWIKRAQAEAYSEDLSRLAAGKEIHCSSDLRSLYPYTDEKGILRVGGRLKHAPIPYQAKHPAILPKKHDIVPLILLHLHQHQRLNHYGVEHILAELRQRYWIPKVRSALKKIAKSCHVCRKHNAKPDPPLMASLPQADSKLSPHTTLVWIILDRC